MYRKIPRGDERLDQTITTQSEHALYSIDVMLCILGHDAEMDQVAGGLSDLIRSLADEPEAEAARLAKPSEHNGCITPVSRVPWRSRCRSPRRSSPGTRCRPRRSIG
jgi:hypothetical protein